MIYGSLSDTPPCIFSTGKTKGGWEAKLYRQSEEQNIPGRDKLQEWIGKWSFILENDRELSKAGAYLALKQLSELIYDEFEKSLIRN